MSKLTNMDDGYVCVPCTVAECASSQIWMMGTCVCLALWQNVQAHKYHTREQFMEDVELIYVNCLSYNGPDSNFTQTARKLMEVCRDSINEVICCHFQEWAAVKKKNPSALELRDPFLVAAVKSD